MASESIVTETETETGVETDPIVSYIESHLSEFSILPTKNKFIRLCFDPYKLFKYGLTPKSISKKLEIFKDCDFLFSPADLGIIDVYFDVPQEINEEQEEEYAAMVKNILLSYELTGIPGVFKVYPKEDGNGFQLETDGSNMRGIYDLQEVKVEETTTNSLWETLSIFGIEAARGVIIDRIKKIMSSNGIYIHPKYIELLTDAMTYRGKFCPTTRHGMDRKILGPFAKCSFEETLDNFIIASVKEETDKLKGISSRIILGLNGNIGAYSEDLLNVGEEGGAEGGAATIVSMDPPQIPPVIERKNPHEERKNGHLAEKRKGTRIIRSVFKSEIVQEN